MPWVMYVWAANNKQYTFCRNGLTKSRSFCLVMFSRQMENSNWLDFFSVCVKPADSVIKTWLVLLSCCCCCCFFPASFPVCTNRTDSVSWLTWSCPWFCYLSLPRINMGEGRGYIGIRLFVCVFRLSVCHPVSVSDCVRSISPEPLNHFKANLVWFCITIKRSITQKNWFKIRGRFKGSKH